MPDTITPTPSPPEAYIDSVITEEWCLAWIAKHLSVLLTDPDPTPSRRNYKLDRIRIWEGRLAHVRKHGPTVVQDIDSGYTRT
jgi:hypothetical protein